jgi:hypothetical protein
VPVHKEYTSNTPRCIRRRAGTQSVGSTSTIDEDRRRGRNLDVVSTDARALLQEALTLPDEERAGIAAELIASLDDPDQDDPALVRASWAEELERRARQVTAGESRGEDWTSLRARLSDDLAGG